MKVSTTFETENTFGDKQHTIRISGHAIRAASKPELQEKVSAAIGQAFTAPKIGIAKVGNQVFVVVEHLGTTNTYAADVSENGIAEHREISSSCEDIHTATTSAALHAFKVDPTSYEKLFTEEVPAGMPESRVNDWLWYARGIKETHQLIRELEKKI